MEKLDSGKVILPIETYESMKSEISSLKEQLAKKTIVKYALSTNQSDIIIALLALAVLLIFCLK